MDDHEKGGKSWPCSGMLLAPSVWLMYQVYERSILSTFVGHGWESVIANEAGEILAHLRMWEDRTVVDENWQPTLVGQNVAHLSEGFREVTGFELEDSQPWARDIVEGGVK